MPAPHPCGAISVQVARKMGASLEAADLGVRCGPRVARILEPKTLNSLELFAVAKFYLDLVPVVRPGSAVARTLQSIA